MSEHDRLILGRNAEMFVPAGASNFAVGLNALTTGVDNDAFAVGLNALTTGVDNDADATMIGWYAARIIHEGRRYAGPWQLHNGRWRRRVYEWDRADWAMVTCRWRYGPEV